MTRQLIKTQCPNYNCGYEELSEHPYESCPGCGETLIPISDYYDIHEEDEEGEIDEY